jgi:hypothetical protein
MVTASRLTLRLVLVCGLAAAPVAGQQPAPASLGTAVEGFLSEWLRGSPDAAAQRYLSDFSRSRAEVLPQGDQPGKPPPGSGVQRLSSELRRVRGELWAGKPAQAMAAPTTMESLAEVLPAIQQRDISLRPLEQPQALAFPVRTWDDLTWTGTAGPRHRALFENAAALAKQPYWGVISRLRTSSDEIVPMLLVWRAEGAADQPTSWKLVTLLPILTR